MENKMKNGNELLISGFDNPLPSTEYILGKIKTPPSVKPNAGCQWNIRPTPNTERRIIKRGRT
jgi:hypothetical protein